VKEHLEKFSKQYIQIQKNPNIKKVVALKKLLIENENYGFPVTSIREIMIMKRLHHKNLMSLIEIVVSKPDKEKNKDRGNIYLVLEYMEHDLSGFYKIKEKYNISHIKCILYQILNGMYYLHKNNIIHRDIKSANILMNNKGEIKIGDFGLARLINPEKKNDNKTQLVVTLWYRAPEILLGDYNYNFKIDVWSIGCVFF